MKLSQQIHMMGTTIDLLIEDDQADLKLEIACQLLDIYNKRFSANDSGSELSQINHQAGLKPVQIHPELFELIKIGKKESLSTPSNLNIALGPVTQAWHIGFPDAKLPDSQEIQKLLLLSNPEMIILDEENLTVFLQQKGMIIDLGALAKGYIADQIIKKINASSILINLGGNVLVSGPNSNRESSAWNIGIQSPTKPRGIHVGVVSIGNQSVVTSGIYERSFELEGKTYHHIFSSRTGYPIETEMASLTILADKSLTCEIWTTRLFGLPILDVIQIIDDRPEIEGIIITKAGQILYSENIKSHFNFI